MGNSQVVMFNFDAILECRIHKKFNNVSDLLSFCQLLILQFKENTEKERFRRAVEVEGRSKEIGAGSVKANCRG